MFNQVLSKRGHNPDLVQVITGYGQTGAALIKGGVDKVLFIGSPVKKKKKSFGGSFQKKILPLSKSKQIFF